MRPRRVILLIELKTNETISALKEATRESLNYGGESILTKVVQIQANVVQRKKKITKK
jgi:hypothetical protein